MRKVLQVRNDMELKTLRRAGIIRVGRIFSSNSFVLSSFQSFNTMLWGGIPSLVGFSSFAVAAITRDEPLSADVIFPALSLFMILQFPLAMVSLSLSMLLYCQLTSVTVRSSHLQYR